MLGFGGRAKAQEPEPQTAAEGEDETEASRVRDMGTAPLRAYVSEIFNEMNGKMAEAQEREGDPTWLEEANSIIRRLVTCAVKDTQVVIDAMEEEGCAHNIMGLINNPMEDTEMKFSSSAVMALIALSDPEKLPQSDAAAGGPPGCVTIRNACAVLRNTTSSAPSACAELVPHLPVVMSLLAAMSRPAGLEHAREAADALAAAARSACEYADAFPPKAAACSVDAAGRAMLHAARSPAAPGVAEAAAASVLA
eukprot:gene39433-50182_t